MKLLRQILSESADATDQQIKVGDIIRTKKMSMRGVVSKVDGREVHYYSVDSKNNPVLSPSGKTKQYFTYISNVVKEGAVAKLDERCWSGYKPTPGKKAYEKGSCMKEASIAEDAEYDGKKVTLDKPFRTPDGPKKFAVYVKNDKGNVIKLGFGDPDMEIKRDDPENRKNYRARHNCADPGPKWKANYWSCKMWDDEPVSDIVEAVGDKYFVSWAEPEKTFLKRAGMKFPVHKEFAAAKEVDTYLSKWLMKDPQDGLNLEMVKNFFPVRDSGKNEYGLKVVDTKDKEIYRDTTPGFKKKHKLKDIVVEINGTKRLIGNVIRSIKTEGGDEVVVESAPPDPKIEKWIKDNKQRFKDEYGEKKGLEVLYAKAWNMFNAK